MGLMTGESGLILKLVKGMVWEGGKTSQWVAKDPATSSSSLHLSVNVNDVLVSDS